jgi:hypothetical protein
MPQVENVRGAGTAAVGVWDAEAVKHAFGLSLDLGGGCKQHIRVEVALQGLAGASHVTATWARALPRFIVQSRPTTSQPLSAISSSQMPPPLVNTMCGMRKPLCSFFSCDSTRFV